MGANEPGAIWMPNNNAWSGRNGNSVPWIIVHGTAGGSSAEATAQYFKSTEGSDNPVSSHYIIGRDGVIVQCIDEGDSAWANGMITGPAGTGGDGLHHDIWWDGGINPNMRTISIEHVKPSDDNSDALTAPQQASSFALIKHICQRHNIPMRPADATGGITGHYSIDPANRSHCPGTYDWNGLYAYLKGDAMGVPQGWKDNGQVLTAPNGVPVTDGFRKWILSHNWDANNVPLLPAQGLNPVEQGNPGLGGGTVLPCLTCVLVWTAKKGVYEMWVGQEYVALHNELIKMQTDLSTAQAQVKSLQAQALSAQNSTPVINDLKARLNQIITIADTSGGFLTK